MAKDTCILCGIETVYDFETHIDNRIGYIEGAGQLCSDCFKEGTTNRNLVTIPENWITKFSNNFELGKRVRTHYWDTHSKDKIK
jgi:hypothetical protein